MRGRPVAGLGPLERTAARTADVDAETMLKLLMGTPVDPGFTDDINDLRRLEAPAGDPYPLAKPISAPDRRRAAPKSDLGPWCVWLESRAGDR